VWRDEGRDKSRPYNAHTASGLGLRNGNGVFRLRNKKTSPMGEVFVCLPLRVVF